MKVIPFIVRYYATNNPDFLKRKTILTIYYCIHMIITFYENV
jgi:hypothetical protein